MTFDDLVFVPHGACRLAIHDFPNGYGIHVVQYKADGVYVGGYEAGRRHNGSVDEALGDNLTAEDVTNFMTTIGAL